MGSLRTQPFGDLDQSVCDPSPAPCGFHLLDQEERFQSHHQVNMFLGGEIRRGCTGRLAGAKWV